MNPWLEHISWTTIQCVMCMGSIGDKYFLYIVCNNLIVLVRQKLPYCWSYSHLIYMILSNVYMVVDALVQGLLVIGCILPFKRWKCTEVLFFNMQILIVGLPTYDMDSQDLILAIWSTHHRLCILHTYTCSSSCGWRQCEIMRTFVQVWLDDVSIDIACDRDNNIVKFCAPQLEVWTR